MSKIGLILLLAIAARAQFGPATGSPFSVGTGPQSIASGDFNGDGRPDLVTANSSANTLTVLLGNGAGGFTPVGGSPPVVSGSPRAVAASDLNGDGKLDLAIANFTTNSVTVLLGDGTGHFSPSPQGPFAVGASPIFVVSADFNGDGKTDLAVVNSGDDTVTVLLGNAASGFVPAAGSPFAVGSFPQSAAVGDINRDGVLDLVTTNYSANNVTVLLGNGNGGFVPAPASPVSVGLSPLSASLADLNGDGKLDLIAANFGDNTISVLLGDGSGHFAAASGSPIALGAKPRSIVTMDFNGDGFPDIVSVNSSNDIAVLAGDGSGGFVAAPGSPFPVGAGPVSAVSADFNGDGKPDIAIPNLAANSVTVYLNVLPTLSASLSSVNFYAGVGRAAPSAIPIGVSSSASGATYSAVSDSPWLVPAPSTNATGGVTAMNLSANTASLAAGAYTAVLRYSAPGYFGSATTARLSIANPSGILQTGVSSFSVGSNPQAIAAGDFNGDGAPDLVTANYGGNSISVLLADGSGGFTPGPGGPIAAGTNPPALAVADFNGDGKADIVVANSASNNLTILLGNGSGGFAPSAGSPIPTGLDPLSVAVADFNGDGKPDIVVANNGAQNLTVLLGNGTGGFAAAPGSPIPVGASPESVATGDLNGDGKPDIVVAAFNNKVSVLLGNGLGGFAGAGAFPTGSFPQSVALADVNNDGKLDVVTANSGGNSVTVLLGTGTGSFTAAQGSPTPVGTNPQSVTLADMDGDGKLDVITANILDNTISVLLGNGSGRFTAATGSPFAAGVTPYSIAAGDFNADGRVDLAVANLSAGAVTVLTGAPAPTSAALSTTAASTVTFGASIPVTLRITLPSGGFNPPTGTATFQDNGSPLGTAAQTSSPYTYTVAGLAPGNHALTASYGGDAASASSLSNSVSITVNPASQSISFAALATRAYGSAPFSVAAAASSSLAVAFVSITPLVCTATGAAVTIVSVGTCTIEASQAGDGNYAPATPVDQSFLVTRAAQTISFAPLSNLAIGTGPVPLSATVSSGLSVVFTSTTTAVCTVAGGAVTLVSAGACTIQATQPGDTNFSPANSVSQHFSVTSAGQTLTFGPLSDVAFGSAPFAVSASASSGLPVIFTSTTSRVCAVSGVTVTVVGGGACTIQAAQPGNTSYAAATPVLQTFNVTPGTQTITFGTFSDQPLGSAALKLTATASSKLPVSFISLAPSICTVSGASLPSCQYQ